VVLLLLRMMGRDWVQAPGWPRLIGRGSARPRATETKPHQSLMIVPVVLPCGCLVAQPSIVASSVAVVVAPS
jgi:hypothetical protein